MPFNSLTYLAFLVAAVIAFWQLPQAWRRPFVLIVSLGFYASWGITFVLFPPLIAATVYVFGRRIGKDLAKREMWRWLGIVLALTPLIAFKYGKFLFVNLFALTAHPVWQSFTIEKTIAFPVGLSFYTFEAISYLVDVSQRRVTPPKLVDLCLFFLFWPNILSGPIVRAKELMPQLAFRKPFQASFVWAGFDRIIWGLIQKNVFANLLGIWVDKGFSNLSAAPTSLDGWFLAVAFGLQIYFDFAGYTNLAIGAARLLGVTLPENFRQPYLASSPVDFWARWHMTLSRWIRDYLFFPISARWSGTPVVIYLGLIGVMALVGLWHGAAWTFVVWGALHGGYLAMFRMYERASGKRAFSKPSRPLRIFWRMLTLVCITIAWVPFRAANLHYAGVVLSAMLLRLHGGRVYSNVFYALTVAFAAFCVIEPVLTDRLEKLDEQLEDQLSPFRVLIRPMLYAIGLLLFLAFDTSTTQFIYSQF